MNVNLDRRITIEQKVMGKDSTGGPAPTWAVLATPWAEVVDARPSRSEAVKMGLEQARNQVRIRIRYRGDLDSSMRVRFGARTLQIIGGPAEIGRREYEEIMCEESAPHG